MSKILKVVTVSYLLGLLAVLAVAGGLRAGEPASPQRSALTETVSG